MPNKLSTVKISCEIGAIAIVSSEPLYRLCWLLNQHFGWSLSETGKLSLMHPERKEIQSFYAYCWHDEATNTKYLLIQNKGAQGPFDTTLKQADYWLRIEGGANITDISAKIKSMNEIQLSQVIKRSDLKKNSFVFQPTLSSPYCNG